MNKNYLQKYFKLCSKNALKKYRLQVYEIGKRASNYVIFFFVIQMIDIIHSSFRKTTLQIVSRD